MDNMSDNVLGNPNYTIIKDITNTMHMNIGERIDSVYNFIDTLDLEELNKIIQYCEEQKIVIDLIDKRKKKLAEILRIERIKFRKEMNNMEKQLVKKKIEEDSESSECEEDVTEKKKPILKKKTKK